MKKYDCTEDIREHARQVKYFIDDIRGQMDYWNTVHNVPITYLSPDGPKQNSDSYWVALK